MKYVDMFLNGFLWVGGAIVVSTIFEKSLHWAINVH